MQPDIDKAKIKNDRRFIEELANPLSDRDWDQFLELLARSPAPTSKLKEAAKRHKAKN